jgi:hypothetical protein
MVSKAAERSRRQKQDIILEPMALAREPNKDRRTDSVWCKQIEKDFQFSQKRACPQGTSVIPERVATKHTSQLSFAGTLAELAVLSSTDGQP